MAHRALVMSGGGSKGAFQLGAAEYLVNERGLDFQVIAGVSTGSLNAVLLAQGTGLEGLKSSIAELRSLWLGIRSDRDVFTSRFLGKLLAAPDGSARPFAGCDDATVAVTALAAVAGAWCTRVHEVPANADAVRVGEVWREAASQAGAVPGSAGTVAAVGGAAGAGAAGAGTGGSAGRAGGSGTAGEGG